MQENNFKSFILVTSAFHSNRSRAVYEKIMLEKGYGFNMLVYPTDDPHAPIQGWWKSRKGKKHVLLEYLSTIFFMIEH